MPSIGPLAAYPFTPRGEDGRLLTRSFEQLVDSAIVAGVSAIGVLGSTGGFAYMPRSARKRIARSAVEVADGRVPVIVGVGALSTAEVLANLAEAASVGASGALLQPMAYQPLQPEEIFGLYKDASSAATIPIWVYNNPATTGHRFSVDELTKLGRLSGVAGFKDRGANAADIKDRIQKITAELPQRTAKRLDWGFSGDGLGAQILLSGASTWHSALASVLPEICVAIAAAAAADRAPEARALQRQLTPLSVMVRQYGGIRTTHTIAELLGLDAGVLPKPLLPLPRDARALVKMALAGIDVPAPRAEATTPASSQAAPVSAVPAASSAPASSGSAASPAAAESAGPTPRSASRSAAPLKRERNTATPVTDDDSSAPDGAGDKASTLVRSGRHSG